jgi:hypothetical protein
MLNTSRRWLVMNMSQLMNWEHTCKNNTNIFSIISETSNSSGRHMETIQASEPSLLDMVAGTDKDEVQVSSILRHRPGRLQPRVPILRGFPEFILKKN